MLFLTARILSTTPIAGRRFAFSTASPLTHTSAFSSSPLSLHIFKPRFTVAAAHYYSTSTQNHTTASLTERGGAPCTKILQGIMDVHSILYHEDNYAYLIIDKKSGEKAIVDPAQPQRVWKGIVGVDASISSVGTILTTHHHWDHADGNAEFKELANTTRVYGGDDRIQALSHKVGHGDTFQIGSLTVDVIHTPSHTTGHVCYVVSAPTAEGEVASPKAVFTGDTLFVGGTGRFFEGTAAEMCTSLGRLSRLPPDTVVYCGHEYTMSNLKFAAAVEPDNTDLQAKTAWAKAQRAETKPTVPSTIGDELKFNPFMRIDEPAVKRFCGFDTDANVDASEVMQALRTAKNNFK